MNTYRPRYTAALEDLKGTVAYMTEAANFSFQQSIKALMKQDIELADKIIKWDAAINRMERDIKEKAISIIARQQPVATDLRRIMAAIKIAADIERIGDFAVNIAKSTKYIGTANHVKSLETIPRMANIAMEMLQHSLQAFMEEEIETAKQAGEADT